MDVSVFDLKYNSQENTIITMWKGYSVVDDSKVERIFSPDESLS